MGNGDITQSHRVAWAAGFIDGEACIHIYRQKYKTRVSGKPGVTHMLRISIGQNNLEVLESVMEALNVNATIHKVKRGIESNRQCYALHINGKYALKAIELMQPYLVRKKHEAEAALRFWVEGKKDMKTGRAALPQDVFDIREWWYNKLRRMK